jgi:endonuclease-3
MTLAARTAHRKASPRPRQDRQAKNEKRAARAGSQRPARAASASTRKPAARATNGKAATRTAAAAPATAAERRRARTIDRRLSVAYPDAHCTLDHRSPLELLIATILSAQCTDERVNLVTPHLFSKYPTAEHLALAPIGDLEEIIRSTGFYRNKAKAIHGTATILVQNHGGQVPRTMEELLRLPGVARKTANVVLGNAFGEASGVVVDTHVHRVTRRLWLTEELDPVKIERDLMSLLPTRAWVGWSHRVIQHGRRICIARKPRCNECNLADLCPSAELG